MALFGGSRDINLFTTINRELINDIISQQVGYYKFNIQKTVSNIYGEAYEQKYYNGPFLINCLIAKFNKTWSNDDFGPNVNHTTTVNFLREDLKDYQIYPEVGDVFVYVDNYFEIDTVVDNQFIVGKDPEYAYQTDLTNFGKNFSIVVTAHLIPSDKVGLTKERT
jgi:hypothetical protein